MSLLRSGLLLAGIAWALGGTPHAAAQTPAEPPSARGLVVVLVRQLNIRERPHLDAPVIDFSVRGDTLCAVRFEADWVEVTAPHARLDAPVEHGYVARGLVSEIRLTPADLRDAGCGGG